MNGFGISTNDTNVFPYVHFNNFVSRACFAPLPRHWYSTISSMRDLQPIILPNEKSFLSEIEIYLM